MLCAQWRPSGTNALAIMHGAESADEELSDALDDGVWIQVCGVDVSYPTEGGGCVWRYLLKLLEAVFARGSILPLSVTLARDSDLTG